MRVECCEDVFLVYKKLLLEIVVEVGVGVVSCLALFSEVGGRVVKKGQNFIDVVLPADLRLSRIHSHLILQGRVFTYLRQIASSIAIHSRM